jgi:hypothetical protein
LAIQNIPLSFGAALYELETIRYSFYLPQFRGATIYVLNGFSNIGPHFGAHAPFFSSGELATNYSSPQTTPFTHTPPTSKLAVRNSILAPLLSTPLPPFCVEYPSSERPSVLRRHAHAPQPTPN